jgi:hypothetical protein
LAIDAKVSHSFTSPPDIHFLMELATKRNRQPLPMVGEKFGLRLPPERHLLVRSNFTCDLSQKKQKQSRFSSGLTPLAISSTPMDVDQHIPHVQPAAPAFFQPIAATAPVVLQTNEDDDYDM